MNDIKIKWLIWTVLIGLVPFFVRLLIHYSANVVTALFTISDLVAFALVMLISTIGTCEQLNDSRAKQKSAVLGSSIILLIFTGIYYALSLIAETKPDFVNIENCTYVLIIFCLVSTLLSYATQDMLHKDNLIRSGG
ncbi:hypothetical protein [Rahnella aceris]|uniref:hypothetical protein n=1 Tax=Rahnella sp. (strain Y9602) TaxID=2703885 RepID=UPI003FCF3B63